MTRQADPLADRTIAAIVGPWSDAPGAMDAGMARLALVTRLMAGWTTNGSLATWAPPAGTDAELGALLRAYLDEGRQLPSWARPDAIELAEDVFMEYGPLSCTLLFCASLPECYVLPHLAEVLHISGQLEANTEYRIRQTAAMVFPVMMKGGLTTPDGGGVAQVLKVRLIHATIRHLILHGPPEAARGRIAPGAPVTPATNMQAAMLAHGWDVDHLGLPCNQLELAYTLLTFGYVFLKGMRTLAEPLTPAQEEATLHAWNVAGHVLGIREELMAQSMDEAARMFDSLQATARATPAVPDVRPALGRALLDTMAKSIRVPLVRQLPVPLTRWLVGPVASREIGADERVGLLTRALFATGLIVTRVIDTVARIFLPGFSLTRMFTRVIGYQFLTRFLLDQTRPLTLPEELLQPMHGTVARWHHDARAPAWVNRLEDRMTTHGEWRPQ
ncbi:DUF2236 domain-containing protein [Caenimonas sedimenti]|uniref:DUF2236 domain-containing protein n=2 Tax=Caenimonas sedimenti TaxID=2596921 RepID=A0A562ZND2_9BURK|nr:DUF2236 domain-containing protein [Caenimonas sedimenti]